MPTREEIIALMQEDEFEGLGTLLQLGEQAVPFLLEILTDPSTPSFLRHRATVVLGEMGSQAAAAHIEALLDHDEPVQRLMAVRALVKIKGTNAADALGPLLNDPDPSVVKVAIQCLAEIGDVTTIAALERVQAESPHDFLRAQAQAAIKDIQERIA